MSRIRSSLPALLALLVLACGCGRGGAVDGAGGDDRGVGKLRVGYSTRTPLHAAVGEVFARTDILERHGFDAELQRFVRGKDQHEACAAGRVGATFSCEVPAMIHLERLPDMRLAGCAGELGEIALVVPAGSPIETTADLAGRSVAVLGGASADLALDRWLDTAELRRDLEVRTESHGGQGETAIEALTQRRVDAAVLWDPWLTAAVLEHDLRVVDAVPFWSVVALFDGHAAVADPGPYLAALAEALAHIGDHPDEVAGWVAEAVGITPEAARRVLGKNSRLGTGAPVDLALSDEVLERLKACERHARMTGDVSPSFRLEGRL